MALTITNISPNTGSLVGGITASLTGTEFATGMVVLFGGVPSFQVFVDSSTTARAVVPPHASGAVDVKIVNYSTLIPEDSGTVSHLYVQGGSILDSKGVAWTEVGTVPRVTSTLLSGLCSASLEGIGPFLSTAYVKTTLGSGSPFNFPTGDFTVTIVFNAGISTSNYEALLSAMDGGWHGYLLNPFIFSINTFQLQPVFGSGGGYAGPVVQWPTGSFSVLSMGRSGSYVVCKLNGGAYGSTVVSDPYLHGVSSGSTFLGYFGSTPGYDSPDVPFSGTIFEVHATTTTPSSGYLLSLHSTILGS